MFQQNKIDSKNVRATLSTDYSEHLEFICSRPTIPVPMAEMQKTLLWQEYQEAGDDEIEIALDELEFFDVSLEGMQ